MGLLSSKNSVTRYKVSGKLEAPVHEFVYHALKDYALSTLEDEASDMVVGWTSVDYPFAPDFEGYSFVFGTYMLFSLRIDKKSIPSKLIQKHYAQEVARRKAETGREFLARHEEKAIKDHVINRLSRRVPSIPNVYDLIWNHPEADLWFFSNMKTANEELETLFFKSFNLHLIRLFPYTIAELLCDLAHGERDYLQQLSPTDFTR